MEDRELTKLAIISGWITNILLIVILFILVFGFCYLSDQVKTINTVTVDVRDLADYEMLNHDNDSNTTNSDDYKNEKSYTKVINNHPMKYTTEISYDQLKALSNLYDDLFEDLTEYGCPSCGCRLYVFKSAGKSASARFKCVNCDYESYHVYIHNCKYDSLTKEKLIELYEAGELNSNYEYNSINDL